MKGVFLISLIILVYGYAYSFLLLHLYGGSLLSSEPGTLINSVQFSNRFGLFQTTTGLHCLSVKAVALAGNAICRGVCGSMTMTLMPNSYAESAQGLCGYMISDRLMPTQYGVGWGHAQEE